MGGSFTDPGCLAVAKHADVDGVSSSSGNLYEIVGEIGASAVTLAPDTSLTVGELSTGTFYAMAQTPEDVITDFYQSAASPAEVLPRAQSAACSDHALWRATSVWGMGGVVLAPHLS